jgi:hypothetical protein
MLPPEEFVDLAQSTVETMIIESIEATAAPPHFARGTIGMAKPPQFD